MTDYGNIIQRQDGSYIITRNDMPYHVPEGEEFAALFADVRAYAKANPGKVEQEAPPPAPTLAEVRSAKIAAIDAETSAAITGGFDFPVNGEILHFSYDSNDQQNFADAANAAILGQMGVPGVPQSVTWNGWKVEKDAEGNALSRSLARLDLTFQDFLGLYMAGALAHKAACMERGGLRKAAVDAAQSIEEVEGI